MAHENLGFARRPRNRVDFVFSWIPWGVMHFHPQIGPTWKRGEWPCAFAGCKQWDTFWQTESGFWGFFAFCFLFSLKRLLELESFWAVARALAESYFSAHIKWLQASDSSTPYHVSRGIENRFSLLKMSPNYLWDYMDRQAVIKDISCRAHSFV